MPDDAGIRAQVRPLFSAQKPQQGRFSGTVAAAQGDMFALVYGQSDASWTMMLSTSFLSNAA